MNIGSDMAAVNCLDVNRYRVDIFDSVLPLTSSKYGWVLVVGYTRQKFNMDTKNGHVQSRSHRFQGPPLVFERYRDWLSRFSLSGGGFAIPVSKRQSLRHLTFQRMVVASGVETWDMSMSCSFLSGRLINVYIAYVFLIELWSDSNWLIHFADEVMGPSSEGSDL